MENYKKQDKKNQKKDKRNKRKREKRKQWKIMNYRAEHMELYLKKTENGDKQWMKWKGKDIGEIEGMHINNKVIEKFQKHQYNKCWIFALVNKETPLRNLTLYDGLNNWCGCGEIDLGADMFTYHVRRSHRGIIPIHSQLNRPFWYDCVKYLSEDIEEKICYTMDELEDLGK